MKATAAPAKRVWKAAETAAQFRTVSHGSRGFVRFHVLLHCVISPISHRFRTVSHMFRPLSTSFTFDRGVVHVAVGVDDHAGIPAKDAAKL